MKYSISMRAASMVLAIVINCAAHDRHITVEANTIDMTENNAELVYYTPIKFSASGIRCFLQHTFTQEKYLDVLPYDMSHLVQFLEHGVQSQQSRGFAQSVIRLFGNKLKSCPAISSFACAELLKKATPLLERNFSHEADYAFDMMHKKINDILYNNFLTNFATCKSDPDLFFGSISNEVINSVHPEFSSHDISYEELRKTLLVFLETVLNKLVWSPQDGIDSWHTTKTIAKQLEELLDAGILLDQDDLNDLFISLVERFCYFIDLTGADLAIDFYQTVKEEVARHDLLFLELEEQEKFLEKKSDRLMRALLAGEAQARGREYGIVVR